MGIFDSVKRWRASLGAPEPSPQAPASPLPVETVLTDDPTADGYLGPERRGRPRVNARSGTKVLIVDDSPTVVTVLRKLMQQNDYRTFEAYSAEEALESIKHERPDLIFLDIVLPGMDGFSALRAFRRDPATKDVPIIMISGNSQATEQFYVQRIGADDFMKKPFSRAEVFARIERLVDDDGIPRRGSALAASQAAAAAATAAT
ncbi:MAG: response regulator [Xanthomonadaceae bacterium]|nr:response regulator [Xanthomonadaceae bacterium]